MKNVLKTIALLVLFLFYVQELSSQNNSLAADVPAIANTKIPFDFDWRFALNDHPGAERPGFDDSQWRLVDVPHDFSIEHPFDSAYVTGAGGGYTYSGIG